MLNVRGLLVLCRLDTFRQWDRNYDTVSCPHPQSIAGHHQSCDSHKREAQFTRTCNTHKEQTCLLFLSILKKK